MKISIITACYNSEATIEDTIRSVISQDYENLEFIIIDGASTDRTMRIIEKYRAKIHKIISEKDYGIYFAFNKGIRMASGDVVGILNSDDFYASSKVLSSVAEKFKTSGCDCLYSDILFISKSNPSKIIRYWKAKEYQHGMFLKGWMPPHPTFFVKRELYNRYGFYNESLQYSADYELMLRFIHRYRISTAYLPEITIKMRMGGFGNESIRAKIQANLEDRKAWMLNGMNPGFFTLLYKPVSKIGQFFKKNYPKFYGKQDH